MFYIQKITVIFMQKYPISIINISDGFLFTYSQIDLKSLVDCDKCDANYLKYNW